MFPSLIREGADLNAAAADGSTALHSAVAAGQADTVRALVKLGAHVFARDGGGTTPVDLAVALARGGRIAMTLPNGGSRVLDVEQAVALEILATLRNPKMVVIEGWLHKRTTSTLKVCAGGENGSFFFFFFLLTLQRRAKLFDAMGCH